MVNSLAAQGVRFDICENTLKTIKREKGTVPPLNANAIKVTAGIARIMTLVNKGYILVRP
jgi:intracellular sulfur oxidation DsrE/DsrF family protein